MFPILFVQLLHQAATEMVSVQPYGPLMCQRLAHILTNKTDPINFDPEHLTCQVDVPETLGIRMRCVMCTEIPGASDSEQVCQTVNSHTVCSLISNNRSCVFTDNIDILNKGRKMINLTEWRRVGPPCGKQLKDRVSADLLHSGDIVVIYLCKIQTDKKKESKVREAGLTKRQGTVYRRERVACSRDFCAVNPDCTHGDMSGERYVTGRESINCYFGRDDVPGVVILTQIGRSKLFQQLLGLGAVISRPIHMDKGILHRAAIQNIISPVKHLVEIGLDIEYRDAKFGVTPFLVAAMVGNVAVLDYLGHVGSNVNAVSNIGKNALHLAAESEYIEIIKHVLNMNCSIDIEAREVEHGFTPFLVAASRGNVAVLDYLGRVGSNVNAVLNNGKNALHLAAESGHIEIIKHVLNMNCSIDLLTKTPKGHIPINYAFTFQNANVVAKIKAIMESEHKGIIIE